MGEQTEEPGLILVVCVYSARFEERPPAAPVSRSKFSTSQVKFELPRIIENSRVHAKGRSKAPKTKGACNADVTEFGKSTGFCYQLGQGCFITALFSRLCKSIFSRLYFRHTFCSCCCCCFLLVSSSFLSNLKKDAPLPAHVLRRCHSSNSIVRYKKLEQWLTRTKTPGSRFY